MPIYGADWVNFVHYDNGESSVFAVREPVSKNGRAVTTDLLQRTVCRKNAAGAKAAAALVKKRLVYVGIILICFQVGLNSNYRRRLCKLLKRKCCKPFMNIVYYIRRKM